MHRLPSPRQSSCDVRRATLEDFRGGGFLAKPQYLVGPQGPPGDTQRHFRARIWADRGARTVPFFNLYDDIQITQLGAMLAS